MKEEKNKNLELYDKVKVVPENAKKSFNNGRFSGTDINSMWRIKKLTEEFGACGIGWYTDVLDQWIENGTENEKMANVKIALFIKQDDEWSKPIIGMGGNKLTTMQKNGVYVSDECYKMAYTDAIGAACKMIGMGADVYWNEDRTKYSGVTENELDLLEQFNNLVRETNIDLEAILIKCNVSSTAQMTSEQLKSAINFMNKLKNKKE